MVRRAEMLDFTGSRHFGAEIKKVIAEVNITVLQLGICWYCIYQRMPGRIHSMKLSSIRGYNVVNFIHGPTNRNLLTRVHPRVRLQSLDLPSKDLSNWWGRQCEVLPLEISTTRMSSPHNILDFYGQLSRRTLSGSSVARILLLLHGSQKKCTPRCLELRLGN
jgi:hypothetical protein